MSKLNRYVVNKNFKVVFRGDHAPCSKDHGEFELSEKLPRAALLEVAKSHDLTPKGKTQKEIYESLVALLDAEKIPELGKMSETDKFKEIVKAGIEAGKDQDDILVKLVESGCKFSLAQKVYKQALETLGVVVSKKDAIETVKSILGADFAPKSSDDLLAAVAKVKNESKLDDPAALKAIKRFLKAEKREVPKAAVVKKEQKKAFGVSGRKAITMQWIAENPNATVQDLEKHAKEMVKPEKLAGFVRRMAPMLEFAAYLTAKKAA